MGLFIRAHINLGWVCASILRVFAVLVIRQNDLPPIYDWCARATFYRTLLLTRGTSGLYFRVLDFKPLPSQLLIGLKNVAGGTYLQNTRDEHQNIMNIKTS